MTIYEKARELGGLIVNSEQGIAINEAKEKFEADEAAVKMRDEYLAYQTNIQESMEKGVLDKGAFADATKRLTEMSAELKKNESFFELYKAEQEFNFLVNQVISVIKTTIMGDDEGCDSDCECCGGCH
ncbi:MAG: YlbF family regulator [Clostridiales bacterium]|jgi:cell fate (sporulation/competence/biofilm development) regulator YlbF (YheA/YmcA/DUF963 family)|nr:YlbF family regulator [Clostridiales bacterium]